MKIYYLKILNGNKISETEKWIDVGYRNRGDLPQMLSNLFPYSFKFRGKKLASIENFFQGIKYLMDNKFIKAIDRIERCYDLALSDGEVDRAILDLKLLNELYLDHGLQNKLKKVKELQENFYKMSYANQIIEDIGLKLN